MPALRNTMQIALILGNATSTVKHPTLRGAKLMVVQALMAESDPDALVARWARFDVAISARLAPLYPVLQVAADADPIRRRARTRTGRILMN